MWHTRDCVKASCNRYCPQSYQTAICKSCFFKGEGGWEKSKHWLRAPSLAGHNAHIYKVVIFIKLAYSCRKSPSRFCFLVTVLLYKPQRAVVPATWCRTCSKIYIGETGRRLGDRFRKHLRSTRQKYTDLPVWSSFHMTKTCLYWYASVRNPLWLPRYPR